MGIVLQSQPEAYGLAYNDNPYVMRSTAYTATQRFKIGVLPSTWPVDPAFATVRVYPRQGVDSNGVITQDRAYYDPSRILQSMIAPNIAIPGANHEAQFDAPNMHQEYRLFIEEEDKNVDGVYEAGAFIFTNAKSVWNGVRDTRDWLDFDYEDYLIETASTDRKFLTDAPLTRYIDSNQSAFLYVLTEAAKSPTFKVYDSDDVLLRTSTVSVPSGLDPATNAAQRLLRLAVGSYDFLNIDPSAVIGSAPSLTNASYYTVTYGSATETVRFNLNQKCSKYTSIRIHWLNKLGGFDVFNFNLKSEEQTDIKRASYEQNPHSFTGYNWEYEKSSRGTTDYDVQTIDKLTVNTDYLTEDESTWMNDLVTSPVVYQELNNELIAVNVKDKRYKKQTSLNDKLMQYTIELEYSLKNMRQRG